MTRTITTLFAVVQLLLPGVLSVVDAIAAQHDARPGSFTTHVEETRQKTCRQTHAADCGVCRYLSTLASVCPTATYSFSTVERTQTRSDAPGAEHRAPLRRFNSRAPPALIA